jgi:membrane protein
VRLSGRVQAIQQWLARRADTKLGRLGFRWFRSYFEASRNSGSAATLYSLLSVVPVVLATVGLASAAGANTNAVAERLVSHLRLHGTTAELVEQTFGSASSNALAASLAAVASFFIWGIGIGQIYQLVYARAWRVEVNTLSDQWRFALWFFAFAAGGAVPFLIEGWLSRAAWAAIIPAWIVAAMLFWVWTPRFLLHREVSVRRLVPGALLTAVVVGGATATSPFFLGGWVNSDAKYFGSFGVVLALVGWGFVLVTLTMVCAVFSPVWARWRADELDESII